MGSLCHLLSKNSRFEVPKFHQSLSQNSRFSVIWMVGLSTNSRFEGATEQKFFEAPYIVIEEKDLILGNKKRKPGFIFKQVHVLSLDSLGQVLG